MKINRQIPIIPSTKSIATLRGMVMRDELILQPEFQRKLVWNAKHKEAFIDTILKGYPFPEIYIAQTGVDLEKLQTQQVVVDGQQRISTILNYIDGTLELEEVPPFTSLSDEEKNIFLQYNVMVRDLGDMESETIKEVFRRINQTKYNLNSIEIQNALYDGEFITAGKTILDEFGKDENLPVFNEIDSNRMVDLYFVLTLMATYEEDGYFSANTKTDEYIKRYDDKYENKEKTIEQFNRVINLIKDFQLEPSSMWFRKSNFFTLVVELLKLDVKPENIKDKLNNFEINVLASKDKLETEFGKYYAAMYTGTNNRAHRIERGDIFKKYVLN